METFPDATDKLIPPLIGEGWFKFNTSKKTAGKFVFPEKHTSTLRFRKIPVPSKVERYGLVATYASEHWNYVTTESIEAYATTIAPFDLAPLGEFKDVVFPKDLPDGLTGRGEERVDLAIRQATADPEVLDWEVHAFWGRLTKFEISDPRDRGEDPAEGLELAGCSAPPPLFEHCQARYPRINDPSVPRGHGREALGQSPARPAVGLRLSPQGQGPDLALAAEVG